MRSRVRKEVLKIFRQSFESQYPGFTLIEGPDAYCAVWSMEIASGVYGCVALIFLRTNDSFLIELGWSPLNEFPWDFDSSRNNYKLPEGRVRMGELWNRGGTEVEWDLAPETFQGDEIESWGDPPLETVLPRIEPTVKDCLKRFQKYGVRYFNKVANARGLGDVL
ncbi:MAG: hypothetical protein WCJ09_13435 [Planctomycetota bacterium]